MGVGVSVCGRSVPARARGHARLGERDHQQLPYRAVRLAPRGPALFAAHLADDRHQRLAAAAGHCGPAAAQESSAGSSGSSGPDSQPHGRLLRQPARVDRRRQRRRRGLAAPRLAALLRGPLREPADSPRATSQPADRLRAGHSAAEAQRRHAHLSAAAEARAARPSRCHFLCFLTSHTLHYN